jgi:hypothetical protein
MSKITFTTLHKSPTVVSIPEVSDQQVDLSTLTEEQIAEIHSKLPEYLNYVLLRVQGTLTFEQYLDNIGIVVPTK